MALSAPTVMETRREQMFPKLAAAEIERLQRFGRRQMYAAGEALTRVGEAGPGMIVVLSGEVDVTRRDGAGEAHPVTTHRAGSFLGELAQLSERPALVDSRATSEVEALVLAPEGLRAVLVGEADLGETIMRALILRP